MRPAGLEVAYMVCLLDELVYWSLETLLARGYELYKWYFLCVYFGRVEVGVKVDLRYEEALLWKCLGYIIIKF